LESWDEITTPPPGGSGKLATETLGTPGNLPARDPRAHAPAQPGPKELTAAAPCPERKRLVPKQSVALASIYPVSERAIAVQVC
jgi:hypothetical protein